MEEKEVEEGLILTYCWLCHFSSTSRNGVNIKAAEPTMAARRTWIAWMSRLGDSARPSSTYSAQQRRGAEGSGRFPLWVDLWGGWFGRRTLPDRGEETKSVRNNQEGQAVKFQRWLYRQTYQIVVARLIHFPSRHTAERVRRTEEGRRTLGEVNHGVLSRGSGKCGPQIWQTNVIH